jgi:signal transduction histidine kinase
VSRDSLDIRREGYAALEQTVLERTRELSAANRHLAEELARRLHAETRVGELLVRVMSIQEDERTRISRDLHDQVGQQITALKLQLEALGQACTQAGAREADVRSRIERAMETISTLDHDLDYYTWELRPAPVDEYGFAGALRRFVAEWSETFSIPAVFHGDGLDGERLGPLVETSLYRILQEALTNVRKHSAATVASVVLERRGAELVLVIDDDGRGFEIRTLDATSLRGIGLLGMRERALLLGGTVVLTSAPGEGTTVFVRLPAESVPSAV